MTDLFPTPVSGENIAASPTFRAITRMVQPDTHAKLLADVLAVVFRDQGDYARAVGVELATRKAMHDVAELQHALDEARIAYCNLHRELTDAIKVAETGRITEALSALTRATTEAHA